MTSQLGNQLITLKLLREKKLSNEVQASQLMIAFRYFQMFTGMIPEISGLGKARIV